MRLFAKIAVAGVLASAPTMAHATDLLTVSTSGNDSIPVADSGFDWNGFYAGVYGSARASAVGGTQLGLGVDIGANARFEFVLVGAEVAVEGLGGGAGATAYLQGLGKTGIALTDSAIVYGSAGIGTSIGGPGESDLLVGGGIDYALTDDVSVGARYLHGIPITGANPKDEFSIGANFHF